jgi:hypothetical protein
MRKLSRSTARPVFVLPLAAAIALVFVQDATAITGGGVVRNCLDSGHASLRDAFSNAVDNEIIDLMNLTCGTITLSNGALVDNKGTTNVTSLGPGAAALTIDANNQDRPLVHKGSGALTIKNLTITHGSYSGVRGGGGIYSHGSVHLYNSTVSACVLTASGSAPANGGGAYSVGAMLLETSIVTGNTIHALRALPEPAPTLVPSNSSAIEFSPTASTSRIYSVAAAASRKYGITSPLSFSVIGLPRRSRDRPAATLIQPSLTQYSSTVVLSWPLKRMPIPRLRIAASWNGLLGSSARRSGKVSTMALTR